MTFRFRNDEVHIGNNEPFALTLLDDVWLSLSAPNVEMRRGGPYIGDGRDGWIVSLRCPTTRRIAAGAQIQFTYDDCIATSYEPGPGARLVGFRLVAREGYLESGVEPAHEIVRKRK